MNPILNHGAYLIKNPPQRLSSVWQFFCLIRKFSLFSIRAAHTITCVYRGTLTSVELWNLTSVIHKMSESDYQIEMVFAPACWQIFPGP